MKDAELKPLLDAVRGGDLEAFEAVYRDLSAPLYTVLCRIVRDRALAEDLLQELFLRLYQSPPAADKPRAYLFQSARNLALDALRKRGAETPLEELELPCQPDTDRRLDVERALESLSALDSQIVTLHLNAGLKFRELAAMLELPLGTVLWRYRRAIGRLRECLDGGVL